MTTNPGSGIKGTIAVPRYLHDRLTLEKTRRIEEAVQIQNSPPPPALSDLVEDAISKYLAGMERVRAGGGSIPIPDRPEETRAEETTTVTISVQVRNALNKEVSQQRIDLDGKIDWTLTQRDVLTAALRQYIDQLPRPA